MALTAGVILDRSGEMKSNFGCAFTSLIEMEVKNFSADNLQPFADLLAQID